MITKPQLFYHNASFPVGGVIQASEFLYLCSLARSQSYDDGLAEIRRRYGDHLYSKGDYGSAIEQYKNAIKHLEPSYVIRKVVPPAVHSSICCLFICLSINPAIHLSVCQSVHQSIYLSCPSSCPFFHPSISLSVHLSVHSSIHVFVCSIWMPSR